MTQATMTSKGQITVPVDVRRDLGLRAGSRVSFVRIAPGVYQLTPARRSIKDLKGSIKYDGPPVTLEEMDRGIAEGAAEGVGR